MTSENQITLMTERFLQYEFPDDMMPDGGLSIDRPSSPVGTNLLNATQAEAMVRFMVADLPATDPAYTYRAKVISIYDGDTITVDIDLGFHMTRHQEKLRLYGVDTPEIRGPERPEGLKAKAFAKMHIPEGSDILLTTLKDKTGKFGRLLAIVWPQGSDISFNEMLIRSGNAEPYFGGKR